MVSPGSCRGSNRTAGRSRSGDLVSIFYREPLAEVLDHLKRWVAIELPGDTRMAAMLHGLAASHRDPIGCLAQLPSAGDGLDRGRRPVDRHPVLSTGSPIPILQVRRIEPSKTTHEG